MGRPDDVVLEFALNKDSENYKALNALLQKLYENHTGDFSYRDIYEELLDCDLSQPTDWATIGEREMAGFSVNSSQYWYQVSARQETIGSMVNLIKVYLSPVDRIHIAEVFVKAIDILLKQGKGGFVAKMAKYKRNDPLCFWVEKVDFPLLESFAESLTLETPLPFVAYRGNMGISREMLSWDSYNAIQAQLIAAYFQTHPTSPDLDEMYRLLIRAWHRDLPDEHPISRQFQYAHAQIFIVLLKSIQVIAGDVQIDDEHYLMRSDIVENRFDYRRPTDAHESAV